MLEGNHLILTGEDYVVLTDDGASADSLDSDLILLTLLPRLGSGRIDSGSGCPSPH